MSWDEQLIEDCREEDGTQHPATDHVLSGAHWMLKQLRTDDAVERVAEAIYRSHDSYTHFTAKPWAEMVKSKDRANKFRVKQDRNAARAAIDALLREA